MTLNLIVPVGAVRFVFYDLKEAKFLEVELSPSNYRRLTVPPNVWFGFKGLGKTNRSNVASHEHDTDEVEIANLDRFKYKW